MKNPKLWLVVLLVALAGAYAASSLYIGHRLTQETALYAQTLSGRPDVRVTRLEYQREFRRGTLHYDLSWLPAEDDPRVAAMQEAGLLTADGLRFAGTLDFRHGPWTGRDGGFALATSAGGIALPEALRPFLPAYPDQAPALQLVAVATFGGELEARFAAIDYRGAVAPAADAQLGLVLAGLAGRLRTNAYLDRFVLDLRLQELVARAEDGDEAATLRVQALAVDFDTVEARPWVWTGTTRVALGHASVTAPGRHFELNDLATETRTWLDGARFNSTSTGTVGRSRLDAHEVLGGSLAVTLQDVDADALSGLAAEANRRAMAGDDPGADQDLAWARPYLQQILAGRPSLRVERLDLSLAAADDLAARVELGFAAGQPYSIEQPESVAQALRVAAEVRMSSSALRHVAGIVVAGQLPPEATEAERAAAAEAFYQEALAGLALLPFLSVGDDQVTASLVISEGRLLVGGVEFMDVTAIIVLMLATLL
jgi:hypothetical protein